MSRCLVHMVTGPVRSQLIYILCIVYIAFEMCTDLIHGIIIPSTYNTYIIYTIYLVGWDVRVLSLDAIGYHCVVNKRYSLSPGLMHGPPSYLKEFDNVYVSAVGTSFYSQCVPSNSVHLGFSASAFHWLSER